MDVKFGAGKARWDWRAHQIALIPTIAVIDRKHYFGYTRFSITVSWLAWGAYAEIWRSKNDAEQK